MKINIPSQNRVHSRTSNYFTSPAILLRANTKHLISLLPLLFLERNQKVTHSNKQAKYEMCKNLISFYLATLEASETTEDVLERREELEDVCPIGNAHLTMVSNQERF